MQADRTAKAPQVNTLKEVLAANRCSLQVLGRTRQVTLKSKGAWKQMALPSLSG